MALDRLLCPADGALGLAPGAGDGVVGAGFKPSSVTRPEEVWKLAAPVFDEMLLAAEPVPERARKAFLAASGERWARGGELAAESLPALLVLVASTAVPGG